MYNPSLQEESRYEPASVIPLKGDTSLLEWLSAQGRLIPREVQEAQIPDEDDEDGITELILDEDPTYDDYEDSDTVDDDFDED